MAAPWLTKNNELILSTSMALCLCRDTMPLPFLIFGTQVKQTKQCFDWALEYRVWHWLTYLPVSPLSIPSVSFLDAVSKRTIVPSALPSSWITKDKHSSNGDCRHSTDSRLSFRVVPWALGIQHWPQLGLGPVPRHLLFAPVTIRIETLESNNFESGQILTYIDTFYRCHEKLPPFSCTCRPYG